MAKKNGKNTRNARQAESFELASTDLEKLPRAEKTDLSNILIRTAAKNEALLEKKMARKGKNDRSKITKKTLEKKLASSITAMDKDRLEKALNFTNRLDGKIAKSKSRAKFVQSTRKAGWDSTNEAIKRDLMLQAGILADATAKTEAESRSTLNTMGEDAMVDEEQIDIVEETTELPTAIEEKTSITLKKVNMFDMLPAEDEE
ncbi:hypothetical protein NCAS_0A07650 [Naumovozyma castellii]|uniref:Shuttling pre-60S factor ECM1 n=1 Tax=Naumovozyma castellii TaxID=27288 RepID=G0V775_NAUCA|nr:hypothetical protein NCAS_0A07650 [Naumovozyma castellii CBS 4309]CCC67323.1 hypothetical protein NCAS_0A07650 [Naumovozyma castellii CBS 4309]